MALKATISNSEKFLLRDLKRLSCILEVLLHLQGEDIKCAPKRQIVRLKIILISNCWNYQMVLTVIMSSLKTHEIKWCWKFGMKKN